ncbi:MAG: SDR family NAD(P)-dependent oxidoreductase [Gammaproteobacteria bacterium]
MGYTISIEGRRALVTGGGQGVGRGIALILAQAGAEVAVNDLVPARAEAIAAEIRAAGGRALAAPFDVTRYDAVAAGIDAVGGVDILVNNAGNAGGTGGFNMKRLVETEPADWEPYLRVNLYGVMHCVRAALPAMIARRWGRVVTIISDAGRVGESHMAAYCAAKAGAAGFCRGVAKEVGRHGITVNNIALGTMHTPLSADRWDKGYDAPENKAALQNYIIRRPGLPEDVAGLVLHLAGDGAAWITGQTYPVNGGYSAAL